MRAKTGANLGNLALCVWLLTAGGKAQTIEDLRREFVGKSVVVEMRIPAKKDGMDIEMGRGQSIDLSEFGKQISKSGVGIERGGVAEITEIRRSKKSLEVVLGAGPKRSPADPPGAQLNIIYESELPTSVLMPEGFRNALANVVRVLDDGSLVSASAATPDDNPWGIRPGLTSQEMRLKFGTPSACSERLVEGEVRTRCVFTREGRHIRAKFVDGVLAEFEITPERDAFPLQ